MLTFLISLFSLSASLSLPHPLRNSIFDPFSLDLLDPFQVFPFDTFRSVAESRPAFVNETSAFANTHIDWKETSEAYVFKANLPCVKKEEVKVEVEEGRVLQISGERSREKEEKSNKWHYVKRSSGSFLRRFRLSENDKVDQVKASMDMMHSILIFFRDERF